MPCARRCLFMLLLGLTACSSTPDKPEPAAPRPTAVHFAVAASPEIAREVKDGPDPYEVFANVVTAFTTMTGTGKGYGRTEISGAVILGPLVSADGTDAAERGEDIRVAGESVTVPMLLLPAAEEADALAKFLEGLGRKSGKPALVRGRDAGADGGLSLCPEGLKIAGRAPGRVVIHAATARPKTPPGEAALVLIPGEGLEVDATVSPPVVTIPRLSGETPRLFTVTIKGDKATFQGWPADQLENIPDKPLSELVVKLK